MRQLNRYIVAAFLTAAIAAPALITAKANAQTVQVRVFDHDHHDYHNWDGREDHAYRGYLIEHHREYREYNRQHHSVQRNYWNWRHSHPDHD